MIEHSESQKGVLIDSLPALVSGTAGSGKTCVAMALLTKQAILDKGHSSLVYVTRSSPLVREMNELWVDSIEVLEAYKKSVKFTSKRDYVLENTHYTPEKIHGFEQFIKWQIKYEGLFKKRGISLLGFSQKVYQELKFIACHKQWNLTLGRIKDKVCFLTMI